MGFCIHLEVLRPPGQPMPGKKSSEKAPARAGDRAPDEWDLEARHLIKGVMVTRRYSFKTLAARLEELGHPIQEKALGLRINRGAFSLGFALLMLRAMDVPDLDIKYIKLGRQYEKLARGLGYRNTDVVLDKDETG